MEIPDFKALLFMKGHSERIPRKNMKPFCGRPLFHWIIETLLKCNYISEIIINTDSEEIAENAEKNFHVTIHMRPDYLNRITSNEANQIIEYDINKTDGKFFLQTHSTNPLLRLDTINNAIRYYIDNIEKYDSLFTVTSQYKRFYYKNGKPINHNPLILEKTQLLKPIFEENSCLYLFTRESFSINNNRIGQKPLMFEINNYESLDIDEQFDFEYAEMVKKND